jgi:hypothetical protein
MEHVGLTMENWWFNAIMGIKPLHEVFANGM